MLINEIEGHVVDGVVIPFEAGCFPFVDACEDGAVDIRVAGGPSGDDGDDVA